MRGVVFGNVKTIPTQPLLGSDIVSSPSNPALRSCCGRSAAREPAVRKRVASPLKGRAYMHPSLNVAERDTRIDRFSSGGL